MAENTFYITTPIYYVNDKPHIGHAYTTILADVLARYHRLMGVPTHFLTGTDEHGQKVQNAAAKSGVTPLEHCDATIVHFQKLWERLNITNDDFIRTTQERHKSVVTKILQDLYNRGLIYKSTYSGWYCTSDERFFTDKDLVDGKCPNGHSVERFEEPCYMYSMSKFQQQLIDYIEAHPDFIQPDNFRNETLGFLRKGPLEDLCISRPKERLSWGIELPFDKDFVAYVWFDALVNYLSAVGYLADEETFRTWWPVNYHLIGKDILTYHTVYWPTMLMGMGVPLPMTVFVHGWWLTNNVKMSKSLKNVVNPMEMIDRCGVDAFRYYLMAAMSLGKDANFTKVLMVLRCNTDLANDLGNLVNRALNLLRKYNNGFIPAAGEPDEALKNACLQAVEEMTKAVDGMKLDSGLAVVMNAVRMGNAYLATTEPWKLAKDESRMPEVLTILRNVLECIRIASGLLFPVMPGKMSELRRSLGIVEERPDIASLKEYFGLKEGTQTELLPPLFPRIDVEPVAAEEALSYAFDANTKEHLPLTVEEIAKKVNYAYDLKMTAASIAPKLAKLSEENPHVACVGKDTYQWKA